VNSASSPDTPPRIRLSDLFEGPLDLLLHLIKVNELDITEVSLTEVTSQYLAYLDAMKELDLELAGEFLVIAATLINLKSRSLLPVHAEEEEAEGEELDATLSTRQLLRRLIEFRKFKELATRLRRLEEQNRGVFYRATVTPILPPPEAETEGPREDIRALFDAFTRVLRTARSRPLHSVRQEQFHVEDKIAELRARVQREKRINLYQVFTRCVCKEEIIVTFLAALELAKSREITIAQAAPFEDILIEPWDDSVVFIG